MKVLVILADGFEEVEALTPIDLLRRAGADVTVCGLEKCGSDNTVRGSHNLRVQTDCLLSERKDDVFDAVVLPGGMPGSKNLALSSDVKDVVMKAYKADKLVCAICAAPVVVLAPLGILDGKKAVCYPGMEIKGGKIDFLSDKVCSSGNVITSRGVGTAIDFSLKITERLFGTDRAEKLAADIVYSGKI